MSDCEQEKLSNAEDGLTSNAFLPVHKRSSRERLGSLSSDLSQLSLRRRCLCISLLVLICLTVVISFAGGSLRRHSVVPVDLSKFGSQPSSVSPLVPVSTRLPERLRPENYFTSPATVHFRDSLHNDTQYITSFLSAGFTNDVMTLGNLIYLGLITSRVPILPPFTSYLGSDVEPLPFSEIFDVPRLILALNAPV
ncbi:hypothetical protein A0H81_00005 [Grifola frondosa]|uniref:Uncharacterized protein n=1 Tax=Grifola frondosa TaxID=5627 RepID=A0A1C7MP97_GRIFR|nr:hypothetical protein A0H81_00005 [Grifola frondosa]